eukprot:4807518-Amphidinium_carterae.1
MTALDDLTTHLTQGKTVLHEYFTASAFTQHKLKSNKAMREKQHRTGITGSLDVVGEVNRPESSTVDLSSPQFAITSNKMHKMTLET